MMRPRFANGDKENDEALLFPRPDHSLIEVNHKSSMIFAMSFGCSLKSKQKDSLVPGTLNDTSNSTDLDFFALLQ